MRLAVLFTIPALFALACGHASAQDAQACPAGWPPCGPDRVLDAQEIGRHLLRAGEGTRIEMTGGTSGRRFVLLLRPDGKLDLSAASGNVGRDWKLEDGKLCLRAYQNVWGGQFNCGTVQVQGGTAFWVEPAGGSRNRIDKVSFVEP